MLLRWLKGGSHDDVTPSWSGPLQSHIVVVSGGAQGSPGDTSAVWSGSRQYRMLMATRARWDTADATGHGGVDKTGLDGATWRCFRKESFLTVPLVRSVSSASCVGSVRRHS